MAAMNRRPATAYFPASFLKWLALNMPIYLEFEYQAWWVIVHRGFKHYSARDIWGWMRHNTALREVDSEWKLNNIHTPYVARLFALRFPDWHDFFEYRAVDDDKHIEVRVTVLLASIEAGFPDVIF